MEIHAKRDTYLGGMLMTDCGLQIRWQKWDGIFLQLPVSCRDKQVSQPYETLLHTKQNTKIFTYIIYIKYLCLITI